MSAEINTTSIDQTPAPVVDLEAILERGEKRFFVEPNTGNRLPYMRYGERHQERNPIVIVNGFTEGLVQNSALADALSIEAETSVLVSDVYRRRDKKSISPTEAIEASAHLLIQMIEREGLQNGPVNIVAHSMGSLVFAEMVRIADEKGWTCFKNESGSKTVFVSPSGTNDDENALSLGLRFAKAGLQDTAKDTWHPTVLAEGQKEILRDRKKWAAEARAAASTKVDYADLATRGVKPMVFGSEYETVYPADIIGPTVARELEAGHIDGYANPIDTRTDGDGLLGVFALESIMTVKGVSRKEAVRAIMKAKGVSKKVAKGMYLQSNLGAHHNHSMVNPAMIAQAVSDYFRGI